MEDSIAEEILPLKKRIDFLAIRNGAAVAGKGFLFTACKQKSNNLSLAQNSARIGFTVTTKHGNSVIRNKIKRRLKEACRVALKEYLLSNHDYNIIGHKSVLNLPFLDLIASLQISAKKYQQIKDMTKKSGKNLRGK